ncbi:MAG: 5'/3'-nucleotidase SurE [Acidimicrobiales bacterium]
MERTGRRRSRIGAAVAVALLLLAGCGSSATKSSSTTSGGSGAATETTVARTLRVLVTNDDGYAAAGIDAVVEALRALPDTEVTVVAPLTNQSGSGGKTTDGPLTVSDVETASGYPAKAVDGYPSDTIVWAIDQHGIDFTPDLVVSGINFGQNVGPLVNISGTVGAARAASARNLPALASSQGLGDPPAYATGVTQVLDWVAGHRASLLDGSAVTARLLENINVPTCPTGTNRGVVDVPVATDAGTRDVNQVDCTSAATDPVDDIAAFTEGFVPLSTLSPTP